MVAILFLSGSTVTSGNRAVIYLTILASAASVLTGLFLRLVLCCVVGVDADDADDADDGGDGGGDSSMDFGGSGVPLSTVNPVLDEE